MKITVEIEIPDNNIGEYTQAIAQQYGVQLKGDDTDITTLAQVISNQLIEGAKQQIVAEAGNQAREAKRAELGL